LGAGFWLVPAFPVPWIFWGTGAALGLTAAALSGWKASAALAAVLAGLSFAPSRALPEDATLLERQPDLMGEVSVHEAGGQRWLSVDNMSQTAVRLSDGESSFEYLHVLELLPLSRPRSKQALLLGLGGGLFSRVLENEYGVAADTVEVNPAVVRLARRWFAFQPSGRLHIGDARAFVRNALPGTYDFVLMDAYGTDGLPPHLATAEFFGELKRALKPGGIAAFNVVGIAEGPHARVWMSLAPS